MQTAQKVTENMKTAVLEGHQPQSSVQYTKYGNTFETLDIVKLIRNRKFGDAEISNDQALLLKIFALFTNNKKDASSDIFSNRENFNAILMSLKI